MEMGHDAIGVFLGNGGRIHPGEIEDVAEDFKILGTRLRLHSEIVDCMLGRLKSPVEEKREFMFSEFSSLLRRLIPHSHSYAKLAFWSVVVDVDAKEMIGRHGDLEVVAEPFGPKVSAMFAAIPMSKVVAVQVVLLFPVVPL